MADDHNQYFVSIIIPSLNEERNIEKCLTAIKEQDFPKDRYEVIMVDNGSKDETVQIASEFGIQVLSKLEGTIGSLRNYGAKCSRGNILGFVDADCQATENWLVVGLKHFNSDRVSAVGCRLRHDQSTWTAKCWSLMHSVKAEEGETEWIPSGCMLVLKQGFDEVNGFNENLITSEDVDLCQRLISKEYKVVSEPRIAALHLDPPKSLVEFFRKELWHGKEMLRTLSGKELKMTNALAYALFCAFCMIGIVFGAVMSFVFDRHVVFLVFLSFFLVAPILLALKTVLLTRSYKSIPGLVLIYMVYGVARSICLLSYCIPKRRQIF